MSSFIKSGSVFLVAGALVFLIAFKDSTHEGPKAGPAEIAVDLPAAWMQDKIWDDGNAEYAVYDANWKRYGRLNPGRVCMLVVKEPWIATKDVKPEDATASNFDVIKLNMIRDINTGVYTYEQMASVFARRDNGALRKYAIASLEACGQTHAMMVKGNLSTNSYWGDQADRAMAWPEGAIPEDALPLYLRGILDGPVPENILVFPSLMAGRLPVLKPVKFTVVRKSGVKVETQAGSFETVEIRLNYGNEFLLYQFNAGSNGTLVRYLNSAGTEYKLAKVERIPYWSMNAPKDESWWPARLR